MRAAFDARDAVAAAQVRPLLATIRRLERWVLALCAVGVLVAGPCGSCWHDGRRVAAAVLGAVMAAAVVLVVWLNLRIGRLTSQMHTLLSPRPR